MNRRDFLKTCSAASAGFLATGYLKAAESAKKPNILFAIADDWGWPHAGAYDDPVVKTPTFDRIAKEGVLFKHAYVSSPSCTPCRNSLLTGQYHWRLGPGASLWSTLDPKTPTYPLELKKAGYHVGSWRKSWGPGRLTGWKDHPAGKPGKGLDAFLKARPKDTPFCFFLGASDPHRPYKRHSGKNSGIDISKIRLFEHYPDCEAIRGDVADYYFEVQRFDSDVGKALKKLEEVGELENTIVVMTGDHGMPFPRCKSNNYDSGARVPLAIRWGAKIKKPGRVIEDFVSFVDLAPTFLDIAGVKIPDVMTGRSLVNILTSEKDGVVEGDTRSFVLHGKERHVPGQEDSLGGYPCRAIRNHDYLYIRNFKPGRWPAGTPHFKKAFKKGAWLTDCDNGPTKTYIDAHREKDELHRKYWEWSFGKRPAEELYDCKKDPGQLKNIADDPKYADVKKKLSDQLMENLKKYGDPRADGGGDEFDKYPYFGGICRPPGAT